MTKKTDLLLETVQSLYRPSADFDGSQSQGAQEWLNGGRTAPLDQQRVDELTTALERSTAEERALFATGLLQFLVQAVTTLPPGVPAYISQFVAQVLGRGQRP